MAQGGVISGQELSDVIRVRDEVAAASGIRAGTRQFDAFSEDLIHVALEGRERCIREVARKLAEKVRAPERR